MRSGNVPLEPVEPLHPLMVCLAAGSAVGTVAIVRVWTDFLDVRTTFLNLRHGQIRNCRMNGKSPRGEIGRKCTPIFIMPRMRARIARSGKPMHMTVLGFTGGKPKIWFATYCEPR